MAERMAKPPRHLAIIMDGNGRWARQRGRSRSMGHIKGTRVAKKIITSCAELGISTLTLFAFSTENWLRPLSEVNLLMKILHRYLAKEADELVAQNIRFSVVGNREKLPDYVREIIVRVEQSTSQCTGMHLVFALSYGARQEITSVVQSIAKDVQSGKIQISEIDEAFVNSKFWTSEDGDPDLIIRTSGEERISNFMLWQAAYSELVFVPVLWPDFTEQDLLTALEKFSTRERRYGKVDTNEILHH